MTQEQRRARKRERAREKKKNRRMRKRQEAATGVAAIVSGADPISEPEDEG
jgi:hypothetical protein